MHSMLGALFAAAASLEWTPYASSGSNATATYTNPILDGIGADPFVHTPCPFLAACLWLARFVVKVDDLYYMTYTTSTNITILRSPVLT